MSGQSSYPDPPSSIDEWYTMFREHFTTAEQSEITITDLQRFAAGTKRSSGSTLTFKQSLFFRAYYPTRIDEFDQVAQDFKEQEFVDRNLWSHVLDVVFAREQKSPQPLAKTLQPLADRSKEPAGPAAGPPKTPMRQTRESSQRTPSAPTKPNRSEHYSTELPMGTFFNFCRVLKSDKYRNYVPWKETHLGTFRSILSQTSDVLPTLLTSAKEERCIWDTPDNTTSPLASKQTIIIEDEDEDDDDDDNGKVDDNDKVDDSSTEDETINVSYFCDFINTALTRVRDFMPRVPKADEIIYHFRSQVLRNPTSCACVPARKHFSLGTILNAYVDAYMRQPMENVPDRMKSGKALIKADEITMIVEAKRSSKVRSRVCSQVTAQLVGWICRRREEFREAFKKNRGKPQRLLLARFGGSKVVFHIASFHYDYFKYLDSVGKDNSMSVFPRGPKGEQNYKKFLCVQRYGPFNIVNDPEQCEQFVQVCIAIDLTSQKRLNTP